MGTAGNDTLVGTNGDDVICGRGGSDRLLGRGGDDVLLGGPGNDVLEGGAGDDLLVGGPGSDALRGGTGDDTIQARDVGQGRDVVACGPGRDSARADLRDRVVGGCEELNQLLRPTDVRLSPSSVAEDAPVGTVVGALAAVDRDRGDTHTFQLVPGAGSADNARVEILGRSLRTAAGLDFESDPVLFVRVRAIDSTGLRHVEALRILVTDVAENRGPVAADDTFDGTEDTTLTLPASGAGGPAGNDTDPDGDLLTVVDVLDASGGSVSLTGGAIELDPATDECGAGAAGFGYVVSDGNGGTDTGRVTIDLSCVDDAPVAVDDTATMAEDAAASAVDVLANDTDVDGGPLSIASASDPANGTVVVTGGGTGLTYRPDGDFCNDPPGTTPDTFTYRLNGGSIATVGVLVTCGDDPPNAVDDVVTVVEDAPATAVGVRANDTDVDGGLVSITAASDPANGTVVITGGGTGLTYRPDADYCNDPPGTAPDTFTYTLSGGSTATVEVTVTCVDDTPVAVDDTTSMDEDAAATAVDVLANDTDVDGGPIEIDSVTQPDDGTVVITGGGTGLTYRPDADYCNDPPGTAPDTFSYTLAPGGSPADVEVTVTCVVDVPVAADDTATVAEDDGPTAIPLLANEHNPDGGPLTIDSVTQPANGAVVITGGGAGLTYEPDADYCNTPPGTALDTFGYTLAPGGDTADVDVTVTCVDDAPVAVDDTATVAEDAAATAVGVLANDTDIDGGPLEIESVTQPDDGTVVITGGGTGLTYKADADYCNTPPGTALDTFSYTLTPGGDTADVEVAVTCADDAPVAVDDTATVNEDAATAAVDVLANDTDIDAGTLEIQSVTQPDDGTVVITGGGTGLTYKPDADYCNEPPGTTPDTFTYTLNGGSTADVEVTVTCVDDAPVAVDDTATVDEDAAATAVDVLANDTDIDGGPLSIVSATDATNGTVAVTGGGTGLTYKPDADYCNEPPGTTPDTFTYLLNGGSTGTVEVTVTCVDDAPVAVDDTATVIVDAAATAVAVLGNDTDVDGGPKSIGSVTQPTNGTVVITGGGTGLTYQPDADYCNEPPGTTPDTFTYRLNGGSTATVSVTVTCDEPPTGVDDTATVAEDAAATAVAVLANDLNADGGPLQVESVTQPTNGTVVITGGGTGLTYRPNANYCDSTADTFTYTLNGGDQATVSVTVTCVDDAPVAVDDAATVTEDAAATAVAVLGNDTDVDAGPKSIGSVTQPANGTVVITGGGTGLTYRPNANYCDSTADTFTYTLNGGDQATVSVTVTCVDDAPVAVDDTATVDEDAAATAVAVLGNDTDVDGGPKSIGSVTQPTNGTVVITGGGTGLTYAPDANYCNDPPDPAADTFSYTLSPGGDTADVAVTVTCVDDAPVAVDDAATVTEDAGATAVAVLGNDTDVDAGPKSIGSVTQPANGTVVITGGGTGLTYRPNANYCDSTADTFTYTLNGGDQATVSVTVTCVDDAPVAVDDTATVDEDAAATAVAVLGNDTDVDAGPKSIGSVTQPTNGTVVITGGGTGLTYAPDANYCNDPPDPAADTFSYTLSPGGDTADVAVTVTCVDDAPVAVDDAATVTEDAAATAIGVRTNDTDVDGGSSSITSVTDPTNGTVAITGGGTGLTYVPDSNYCNNPPGTTPDTFSYTLAPGGSSADVEVTVTCVDDAPVAVDDTATVTEDAGATAVAVLGNDTDVDAGPKSIGSVTQPTNGTVVITGGGTGLTYAPNANYCNNPPGTGPDTFSYTLSPGGDTADVAVTVTCVNDAPVADDETFSGAVGNTVLVVDDAADAAPAVSGAKKVIAGSILTGDTDVDGPGPLEVVAGTFATNDGGRVVLEADGDFTFTPAAGTSCTDTSDFFDYTLTDQATPTAGTDTGRVTIAITGCVWYVDNDAAGDAGTSVAPFDTLVQAEAASAAGHTIHVADGDDTTTGYAAGITLKSNQSLVGEAVDLRVGGDLLLAGTAAARPTLTDLNDDVVSLASGATVTGVDVDPQGFGGVSGAGTAGGTISDVRILDTGVPGTQPGLELAATTGTFNVANLTVQTSGAVGVRVANAGTVVFADTGTISITTAGARGLAVSDTALGASVFDSITVTGSATGAVQLSATTGTPTFTNLALTTTSGAVGAFVLSNAGAVTVPGAGTAQVVAQGGPAVDVSATVADLAFDSVASSDSAGSGISLNALGTGNFSTVTGSISGASGTAFVVSGASSGDVTFPGAISDGTGNTASITGRTGGTVTLSGTLTDGADAAGGIAVSANSGGSTVFSGVSNSFSTGSGVGVSLASNTGHAVTFSGGGLAIASTSGGGLLSSGGGTLVVSGTGNTVTTTTGSALLLDNTTIGAGNATFESISSNGATVGIRASNTGSAGRLIVTGTAGTCANGSSGGCSGGTLANGSGADDGGVTPGGTGIVLNNTLNPSFTRMWVHDFTNYAVRGTSVAGFTLSTSVVNGANGTNGAAPFDDSSIRFDNLTGSVSVSSTFISGGFEDNLRVVNTAGSLNRITLTGVTFGTSGTRPANDALLLQTDSSAGQLHATITGSSFSSAAGDLFQLNHSGSGTGDLVLTGNTFTNAHPSIATGGGGVSLFQSGAGGNTTMNVSNNSFRDAVGPGVLIVKTAGAATQTGTFSSNSIGVNGVADSGSREGSALKLQLVSQGTSTWGVTNNTIRGYNNHGIEVLAGGGGTMAAGTFNTTVTGNDIAQPGTFAGTLSIPKQGIHYNIGTVPGDTFQACADIRSNIISSSGADGSPLTGVDVDVRLRQRQATTIRLPGYVGGTGDDTVVQSFVNANNSPGTTTLAASNVPTGGGFTGAGATCP